MQSELYIQESWRLCINHGCLRLYLGFYIDTLSSWMNHLTCNSLLPKQYVLYLVKISNIRALLVKVQSTQVAAKGRLKCHFFGNGKCSHASAFDFRPSTTLLMSQFSTERTTWKRDKMWRVTKPFQGSSNRVEDYRNIKI